MFRHRYIVRLTKTLPSQGAQPRPMSVSDRTAAISRRNAHTPPQAPVPIRAGGHRYWVWPAQPPATPGAPSSPVVGRYQRFILRSLRVALGTDHRRAPAAFAAILPAVPVPREVPVPDRVPREETSEAVDAPGGKLWNVPCGEPVEVSGGVPRRAGAPGQVVPREHGSRHVPPSRWWDREWPLRAAAGVKSRICCPTGPTQPHRVGVRRRGQHIQ